MSAMAPAPTGRVGGFFGVAVVALLLAGCTPPTDEAPGLDTSAGAPEPAPGIDKPAVAGVVSGDIKTRRQLAEAIEAKNRQNEEHKANRDWRYAQPAVGPKDE